MADKLSESLWTSFIKKARLNLDDGAMVKALVKFDKTDIAKPEPRLAALDEIIEQVKRQVVALPKRKKELGDKVFDEVKDKLYELLGLAEKLQKDTRAATAKAEAAEGEDDSPTLLTSKMIPLLRELRKGEATMHALIGTAGKNTAVLIMRRPVPLARRKMLAEVLDAKGGAKYIVGECLYENNTLTFVVQAPSTGLAKRLHEALLMQTDLRLKVKVRGEDGEEQDGDDESGVQSNTRAETPPMRQASQALSAEQLACEQRLQVVQERLEEALRVQHPESTKLRAVSAFASEKAAAGDFVAAGKALDMIDKLFVVPGNSPSQPAAGKPVSNVVFQQSRLVWDATRKKAHAQLQSLCKAILDDFEGEPDFDEVKAVVGGIDVLLERFDEQLSDKLDEAMNAAVPEAREERQREAAVILQEYRAFVDGDAGLRLLDSNPFLPVDIRKGFLETLTLLGNKLTV